MDEFREIPSCSFYGRKCRLPPSPNISDTSDTSDYEEEMTLKNLQAKMYQNRPQMTCLLSWNITECMVDLEKELAIITDQALEGEEARYGERLIQFASENLVTEILIHPVVSTLAQCMRNLLSSFTRHRHIIHAGYTFAANGSWALQDGTFSLSDFSEAFQELEVQRVIHAYENGITLDLHCSPEGDWTRLPKEPFAKACKVRVNPTDVLTSGSPAITNFTNYIAPFLISTALENILESSDVVGNIRFSRPTLYVFPGGQGDAALFGINGFNMLLDGGFSRKSCFWDFVRHLDRLDAVLMTRLNNSNVGGISSVLRRKKQDAVYPQLGHFFCNLQERKALPSPDGDKDKDPLLINLLDEGQEIISNLRHLNLNPQVCYRDSEPINLYHKVGHGTLDMYVLSPAKDSKEVREFLLKWNQSDQKLFANSKFNREFNFPIQNLISIAALLVWQPANPNDTITRILFPGSSPQKKIFEGLDRLKNLEFIKHPVCTEKSLVPISVTKKTVKDITIDKVIPKEKISVERKENKIIENNVITAVNGEIKEKIVKKSDSTESDRSIKTKKIEEQKIIENGEKPKIKPKPPTRRSDSQQRKKPQEKKASPTTPKKSIVNGESKKPTKPSPISTPAKSAKDATNRRVIESKSKREAAAKPQPPAEPKIKIERKPISRRPKGAPKAPISPVKKVTNGVQKPDSISKKGKLDKEGTTDSSTVSTPSADQESVQKKDLSKLTTVEIENLKAQELADLNEEQEAVKEIEAVFRKGEIRPVQDDTLRKIKEVSVDDKLEKEEYLIIEKEEIDHDSLDEKETKEDEIQKLARDSEESEKQRKLSSEENIAEEQEKSFEAEDFVKVKEEPLETSKVPSPEEKVDVSLTDKKTADKEAEDEVKDIAESQPDEKISANVKSGDTTTAPTLPEDERIPLDEIKEDICRAIEEKHVKEETKEKDVPLIQLPQKSAESASKLSNVAGIRLDKQTHIRDIVKTPDEVADLPVHEEVDYEYTHELKAESIKTNEILEKRADDKMEETMDTVLYEKEKVKLVEQEKDKDEVMQDVSEDIRKTSFMQEELKNLTDTVLRNESILETDILKDSEKSKVTALTDSSLDVPDTKVEDVKHICKTEDITIDESEKVLTKSEAIEKSELEIKEKDDEMEKTVESFVNGDLAESKPLEKDVDSTSKVEIEDEKKLDIKFKEEPEINSGTMTKMLEAEKPVLPLASEKDTEKHADVKDPEKISVEIIEIEEGDIKDTGKPEIDNIVDIPAEESESEFNEKHILKETDKVEDNIKDIPSVEKVKTELSRTNEEILKSTKEDKEDLEKLEEKLQHLKDAVSEVKTSADESKEPEVDYKIKTDELTKQVESEVIENEFDSKTDIGELKSELKTEIKKSLTEEDPLLTNELIEKMELGRKSPQERADDVIKIVASVAEVLKSDAPLEEFEGKLPISTYTPFSTSYTTELRETHITTVDSPTLEFKVIKTDTIPTIPEEPQSMSATFLEEERKITSVHEDDVKKPDDKRSNLLRESQELMMATSKMISDIKSTKPEEKDDDEEAAVVHRMLVTASSEDGGEETEICPPGTITFPKSSESSGRSSPDQSQKISPKSSIIDTISDSLSTVKHVKELDAEKDSGIDDAKSEADQAAQETSPPPEEETNKISKTIDRSPGIQTTEDTLSGKSSPDKDASIKSLASGKSTPDISDFEKSKEIILSFDESRKLEDLLKKEVGVDLAKELSNAELETVRLADVGGEKVDKVIGVIAEKKEIFEQKNVMKLEELKEGETEPVDAKTTSLIETIEGSIVGALEAVSDLTKSLLKHEDKSTKPKEPVETKTEKDDITRETLQTADETVKQDSIVEIIADQIEDAIEKVSEFLQPDADAETIQEKMEDRAESSFPDKTDVSVKAATDEVRKTSEEINVKGSAKLLPELSAVGIVSSITTSKDVLENGTDKTRTDDLVAELTDDTKTIDDRGSSKTITDEQIEDVTQKVDKIKDISEAKIDETLKDVEEEKIKSSDTVIEEKMSSALTPKHIFTKESELGIEDIKESALKILEDKMTDTPSQSEKTEEKLLVEPEADEQSEKIEGTPETLDKQTKKAELPVGADKPEDISKETFDVTSDEKSKITDSLVDATATLISNDTVISMDIDETKKDFKNLVEVSPLKQTEDIVVLKEMTKEEKQTGESKALQEVIEEKQTDETYETKKDFEGKVDVPVSKPSEDITVITEDIEEKKHSAESKVLQEEMGKKQYEENQVVKEEIEKFKEVSEMLTDGITEELPDVMSIKDASDKMDDKKKKAESVVATDKSEDVISEEVDEIKKGFTDNVEVSPVKQTGTIKDAKGDETEKKQSDEAQVAKEEIETAIIEEPPKVISVKDASGKIGDTITKVESLVVTVKAEDSSRKSSDVSSDDSKITASTTDETFTRSLKDSSSVPIQEVEETKKDFEGKVEEPSLKTTDDTIVLKGEIKEEKQTEESSMVKEEIIEEKQTDETKTAKGDIGEFKDVSKELTDTFVEDSPEKMDDKTKKIESLGVTDRSPEVIDADISAIQGKLEDTSLEISKPVKETPQDITEKADISLKQTDVKEEKLIEIAQSKEESKLDDKIIEVVDRSETVADKSKNVESIDMPDKPEDMPKKSSEITKDKLELEDTPLASSERVEETAKHLKDEVADLFSKKSKEEAAQEIVELKEVSITVLDRDVSKKSSDVTTDEIKLEDLKEEATDLSNKQISESKGLKEVTGEERGELKEVSIKVPDRLIDGTSEMLSAKDDVAPNFKSKGSYVEVKEIKDESLDSAEIANQLEGEFDEKISQDIKVPDGPIIIASIDKQSESEEQTLPIKRVDETCEEISDTVDKTKDISRVFTDKQALEDLTDKQIGKSEDAVAKIIIETDVEKMQKVVKDQTEEILEKLDEVEEKPIVADSATSVKEGLLGKLQDTPKLPSKNMEEQVEYESDKGKDVSAKLTKESKEIKEIIDVIDQAEKASEDGSKTADIIIDATKTDDLATPAAKEAADGAIDESFDKTEESQKAEEKLKNVPNEALEKPLKSKTGTTDEAYKEVPRETSVAKDLSSLGEEIKKETLDLLENAKITSQSGLLEDTAKLESTIVEKTKIDLSDKTKDISVDIAKQTVVKTSELLETLEKEEPSEVTLTTDRIAAEQLPLGVDILEKTVTAIPQEMYSKPMSQIPDNEKDKRGEDRELKKQTSKDEEVKTSEVIHDIAKDIIECAEIHDEIPDSGTTLKIKTTDEVAETLTKDTTKESTIEDEDSKLDIEEISDKGKIAVGTADEVPDIQSLVNGSHDKPEGVAASKTLETKLEISKLGESVKYIIDDEKCTEDEKDFKTEKEIEKDSNVETISRTKRKESIVEQLEEGISSTFSAISDFGKSLFRKGEKVIETSSAEVEQANKEIAMTTKDVAEKVEEQLDVAAMDIGKSALEKCCEISKETENSIKHDIKEVTQHPLLDKEIQDDFIEGNKEITAAGKMADIDQSFTEEGIFVPKTDIHESESSEKSSPVLKDDKHDTTEENYTCEHKKDVKMDKEKQSVNGFEEEKRVLTIEEVQQKEDPLKHKELTREYEPVSEMHKNIIEKHKDSAVDLESDMDESFSDIRNGRTISDIDKKEYVEKTSSKSKPGGDIKITEKLPTEIETMDEKQMKKEQVLEETADDLRETFETVADMSKSVVFDKCEKSTEKEATDEKSVTREEEKLLEKTAEDLNETFKSVAKMSKVLSFDKCGVSTDVGDIYPESLRIEEQILEKRAADVNETFQSVSKMSQSLSFDKCEKLHDKLVKEEEKYLQESADDLKETFETLEDMSKSVVFEKCETIERKKSIAEDLIEKVADDVIDAFEAVSDMSKSAFFEKCEKDGHSEKVDLEKAVKDEPSKDLKSSEFIGTGTKSDLDLMATDSDDKEVVEKTPKCAVKELKKCPEVLVTGDKQENICDHLHSVADMSKSIIFEKGEKETMEKSSAKSKDDEKHSIVDVKDTASAPLQPTTSTDTVLKQADSKETLPSTEKLQEGTALDVKETPKKLSISDVEVSLTDKSDTGKQDQKTESKDIDTDSCDKEKGTGDTISSSLAGPSSTIKGLEDLREVEKQMDLQETLLHEKHIPGAVTPPTVPVSPNIIEPSQARREASETELGLRSPTPGSDDFEIISHSEISSSQMSKIFLDSEKIETDEDDDQLSVTSQVAHSRDSSSHHDFDEHTKKMDPMSMSLYGTLPDDSYEEKQLEPTYLYEITKAKFSTTTSDKPYAKLDHSVSKPIEEGGTMSSSCIGELPTSSASQEKKDPIESWGKPLGLPAPPTYLYEITKAKYSSKKTIYFDKQDSEKYLPRETEIPEDEGFDSYSNQHRHIDLMTASVYGDLPTDFSSDKDLISSWGKPLGLPSPAPPNDNKGTPKKDRKLPPNVTAKNKLNDDKKRAESPKLNKNKKINPVYVDLTYVPHHGNAYYSYVDFFKRVRARYYVFSGIEPSREVYNSLLEAKQTWEDKDLEVTIIPTYDTDILGYWVAENEELLTKFKIDLSPSASRCTINLQDHETSCSAYRLEF